jgi:hypothetical protein
MGGTKAAGALRSATLILKSINRSLQQLLSQDSHVQLTFQKHAAARDRQKQQSKLQKAMMAHRRAF